MGRLCSQATLRLAAQVDRSFRIDLIQINASGSDRNQPK
jgi:hypothetical protein